MSAVTPVSTSSPRSPYLHLVTDRWIVLSWLLLIGTGLLSVSMLLSTAAQTPGREVTVFNVVQLFLISGYITWSSYYGLAASWRFAIGAASPLSTIWLTVGCFSLITFGWMFVALGFVYGLFGGGICQFLRRWWLLAHGQRPPFLAVRPRLRW